MFSQIRTSIIFVGLSEFLLEFSESAWVSNIMVSSSKKRFLRSFVHAGVTVVIGQLESGLVPYLVDNYYSTFVDL